MKGLHVVVPLALLAAAVVVASEPAPGSDPRAVALAQATLEKMGGREAWEGTRYLQWNFFGRRLHRWDKFTGDVRIEAGPRIVLMNLLTKEGRVFEEGREIVEPLARREALDEGYAWWVNDSYWLLMPYKLLDEGARLGFGGESALADGRPADRLELTFAPGTGLTPENRYDVWIARDTGLVEQWAYYARAADSAPKFTLPWGGWKRFGRILLATEHGRESPWDVDAPQTLPRSLFEAP